MDQKEENQNIPQEENSTWQTVKDFAQGAWQGVKDAVTKSSATTVLGGLAVGAVATAAGGPVGLAVTVGAIATYSAAKGVQNAISKHKERKENATKEFSDISQEPTNETSKAPSQEPSKEPEVQSKKSDDSAKVAGKWAKLVKEQHAASNKKVDHTH